MSYLEKPDLLLWIQENSCVCGFAWTHSYTTLALGGTPGPEEEHRGRLTRIIATPRRHHNHCHRCVSLSLGIGWESAAPSAPPAPVLRTNALTSVLTKILKPENLK